MKRIFLFLVLCTAVLACSKDEKTYEHWSNLANEKLNEIQALTQKVSCTNIDDFEVVSLGYNIYSLNHPSIKKEFEKLQKEYNNFRAKADKAAGDGRVYNDMIMLPATPPIRKECKNGKATLVLIKDLDLAETNKEIVSRKKEIDTFYKDVVCGNANDWSLIAIPKDCCPEFIPINNKIKRNEFLVLTNTYTQLVSKKHILENKTCVGIVCGQKPPTIACEGEKVVLKPSTL